MLSDRKKYNIMTTIEDDAPSGDVNWCTISFLTPQKVESLKYLDVKGFKIHNGYNTPDLANDDAKKIKDKKNEHDVYLAQMGKIYAWDDATKTEAIEYGQDNLNELERKRRESIDKIKLMSQQFSNERKKTLPQNLDAIKAEALRKKCQLKLYKKGIITQREYEMSLEEEKPINVIKEIAASLEKINGEVDEVFKQDFLDENDPTALKYGCLTIFSPKHINGLTTLCFKVRGLFQTKAELLKRIKKLEELYPHDRIYNFEVGKWCVFSEKDNVEPELLLKQLNYSMKKYIENLGNEKEEFEKRKESLQNKTEQESKLIKTNNRKERRRAKKEAMKDSKDSKDPIDSTEALKDKKITETPNITSIGNATDDDAIRSILDYLDDPELRDKFPSNPETQETVKMEI